MKRNPTSAHTKRPPKQKGGKAAPVPKGGVYTCLDCGYRGWRARINTPCPMCGNKATANNTV